MKYLIISDLHGSFSSLEKVLNFFEDKQCDFLCILGDILNYGPRNGLPPGLNPQAIANALNKMADKIIAVRGNCDSEVDQMLLKFPIQADYALIVDNGVQIFLTHGHLYNEQNWPIGKHQIFFHGHTHLWKLEKSQAHSSIICNTGSVTFPKNGNPPTFAVYENKTITIYQTDGTILKSISI